MTEEMDGEIQALKFVLNISHQEIQSTSLVILVGPDWSKLSNQFYNVCIFNILICKVNLRKGLICSIILCYEQAMVTTFTNLLTGYKDLRIWKTLRSLIYQIMGFLRFEKDSLSNGYADTANLPSLKSCLLRVPPRLLKFKMYQEWVKH